MLDNQDYINNKYYLQNGLCCSCKNYLQFCVCTLTCSTCNNCVQNCVCSQSITCSQPITCNQCNNNICCCDKTMSYSDIYFSWEYIIVIAVLFLIYVPFLISYFYGIYSTWYENLNRDTENTWIIGGLWVVVTIISYIGLYILWRNPTPETISRNLVITVLFFLGNVILVAWSVVFYQFQNISTATWIALILFIFQFWIFIYVWNIDRLAGIFLLPLVGMYLYFFYSMVHLACINNIIL